MQTDALVDVCGWIVEYLLRQGANVDDTILNALVPILPLPNDNAKLTKAFLLRKIESEVSNGTVSKTTLRLLERIEELEQQNGITEETGAFKAAYYALFAHCTVEYLGDYGMIKEGYFEEMKKIWSERVREGVKFGHVSLVAKEFLEWKDKVEAALKEGKGSKEMEAAEAVMAYITEENERMGPSFLELVGEMLNGEANDAISEAIGLRKRMDKDDQAGGKAETLKTQFLIDCEKSKEVQKESVSRAASAETGKIDESQAGDSWDKLEELPISELKKVKGSFESCVVKTPLPFDSRLADTGVSGTVGDNMHDETVRHSDKDEGKNCGNCQTEALKPIPTKGKSNPHGSRGVDSANHLPGNLSIEQNLVRRSSRKSAPSASQSEESEKAKKRRVMKRWRPLEEDALRTGVEKFGKGSWKVILFAYKHIFEERTERRSEPASQGLEIM